MPIQFRCPECHRRLSVATRKAGTRAACPGCSAPITVPSSQPVAQPEAAARRMPIGTWIVLIVLALSAGALGVLANRKSADRADQAARGVSPVPSPVAVGAAPPAPSPEQSPPPPDPPLQTLAVVGAPAPVPPHLPPLAQASPPAVQPPPAPPRQPPVQAVKEPPRVFDPFGNPVGDEHGLGQPGEFRGKTLLFWSGYTGAGRVFFAPTNPLWSALERQGFTVRREFGRFNPAWLKTIDQLWILSTGRFELPAGVPPELLAFAVAQLPPELVPSGFTLAEYQFVVRATLDVMLSPCYPLDEAAYTAIVNFVTAGKGLCLLSDDEPFTVESNELARRLFGVGVGGNYRGDQVAVVRNRKLAPAEVRKFGGQYEVADHPLLTGVNFVFEGITVSHVGMSDRLEVALKASNGQAILAVSKVPGQRVVIDCGFTRYCHGPTERTSYIQKTAGTVRLGQNIAAWLAK